MSILRTRHAATTPKHYAFLVCPIGGFNPRNWQNKPQQFRIIRQVSIMHRRGKVDAWRFIENQKAIAGDSAIDQWAICLT